MYAAKQNAVRCVMMKGVQGPLMMHFNWSAMQKSDAFECYRSDMSSKPRDEVAAKFSKLHDKAVASKVKAGDANRAKAMTLFDTLPSGRMNPLSCFIEQNMERVLQKVKKEASSPAEIEFLVTTELIAEWTNAKARSQKNVVKQVSHRTIMNDPTLPKFVHFTDTDADNANRVN